MGSSGNVWVVLRIQQICNTTRHKSPIYGLFALSKRSQRDSIACERMERHNASLLAVVSFFAFIGNVEMTEMKRKRII